ncbi:MAG: polysaccharide biosynthesis/export family protein [Desulfobacula sp.]|jgi:polysaccharide export outer membrane protein|nr:polysaccharide biosynthesis/export family protein [Desulfobacula sp.]
MQIFLKYSWLSQFFILFFSFILIFCLVIPRISHCETRDQSSAYRLGSEDVITISILAGGEEQVVKEMVVGANGYVTVPFIGKIMASGLTMEELEKAVIKPLEKDYFIAPQVHLRIKEYQSLQFFVSGAVQKPGKYVLDFMPTIMDIIANAGGVLPERGNLAYILRGVTEQEISDTDLEKTISKTEPIKVDLLKLLDEGDMSVNVKLQSGDTVYIPLGTKLNQAATRIYIQGKIKNPKVFDFQPGMTALSVCIMAGGFDQFAAPNRTKIIRKTKDGQETIDLNLDKVISGEVPDFPLQPGDRIHIPESWL